MNGWFIYGPRTTTVLMYIMVADENNDDGFITKMKSRCHSAEPAGCPLEMYESKKGKSKKGQMNLQPNSETLQPNGPSSAFGSYVSEMVPTYNIDSSVPVLIPNLTHIGHFEASSGSSILNVFGTKYMFLISLHL